MGSATPFWMSTYDEYSYLNGFALESYPNFPVYWWNANFAVCPRPGVPGLTPGVRCSTEGPSEGYVTEVNLSPSSLPPDSVKLQGSLKNPPYIVGLLFLTILNLNSTGLNGTLPGSLSLAPQLSKLVLSNNRLTGSLSPDLCSLKLTCLSFKNNSMGGPIPPCFKSFPCRDFEGNNFTNFRTGGCNASKLYESCNPPPAVATSAPPPPPSPPPAEPVTQEPLSVGAVVGIVVGILAFLALLTLGAIMGKIYRDRKREEEERRVFKEQIESELSTGRFGELQRFTEEELSSCCGGFGEENYVGQGGFSSVFKGTLEDGTTVAVKKIKMEGVETGQRELETRFLNELELISRASHKNLANCVGFCLDPGNCLCLVLQFYPNGSVASRTRGGEGNVLSWEERLQVAKGAADGIAYLHTGCATQIIHRDIKAENILLDEKNEAVVADFGLATEAREDSQSQVTGVKGTLGSIAPEYFLSGKCTVKTDVYAFGIFLLELVSGRSVFDLSGGTEAEDEGIHVWLKARLAERDMAALMDPDVDSEDRGLAPNLLRVALACLSGEPDQRPTMVQVCGLLGQDSQRLASQFQRWQEEAQDLTAEDILQHINPAAWENLSTGISLDHSALHGKPR